MAEPVAPRAAAPPPQPPPLADCFFYHSVELPGSGRQTGQWDLEPHLKEYWAGVRFGAQQVLEIGPASGYLTSELERRGARVTALELAAGEMWDVVPFAGWAESAQAEFVAARGRLQRRLLASFWRTHAELELSARLFLGSVYRLSDALGEFDIATVCAVLLHLRDPLSALEQVASRTRERVVVTEAIPGEILPERCVEALIAANRSGDGAELRNEVARLDPGDLRDPGALLLRPDAKTLSPKETWWSLTPRLVAAWLGVLGFEVEAQRLFVLEHDSTYAFHKPPGHQDRRTFHPYFSLSARRMPSVAEG
ncbi:MAG: hypothetical protein DWQ36_11310 [Acidobacteria bacterium]|nr:MAG: hypothetical protein DWQ30_12090 [Acidobacteriota bacterium]REK07794.1 MAG: hypothetical protein DWQ36_11310 [Acidobacteriota bacterium]